MDKFLWYAAIIIFLTIAYPLYFFLRTQYVLLKAEFTLRRLAWKHRNEEVGQHLKDIADQVREGRKSESFINPEEDE